MRVILSKFLNKLANALITFISSNLGRLIILMIGVAGYFLLIVEIHFPPSIQHYNRKLMTATSLVDPRFIS